MDIARGKDALASTLERYGLGLHPRQWRVPPIDTYPRAIAFAKTVPGRLVLIAVFAVLIRLQGWDLWLWTTAAAAITSFAGRHRHVVALLCTGAILARAPDWFNYRAVYLVAEQESLLSSLHLGQVRAATLLACALLAAGSIWLARHYRHHPYGQRPVLIQHAVFLLFLLGVSLAPLHGMSRIVAWSLFTVFLAYFWFMAYAMIDQRTKNPSGLIFQLATFHPFYGSTTSPWGKGAAYLRSVESHTPDELAVTQLKALKLIAWALFLYVLLKVYRKVLYAKLGIPQLDQSFNLYVQFGIGPGPMGALTIIVDYFEQLLMIAAAGHVIIATARLAGFRLLRNTFRPLSSRSIAEFWNRYDYYFKELLVNVYFYPTFLRYFKKHPRLRIAFATFMAAGVGNLLFHFMMENYRIPRDGLFETVAHMQTYAFYCAVLVTGIVVSQLRGRSQSRHDTWFHAQFLPSLKVGSFYCLLSFFDGSESSVELSKHFGFLFHILGIQ